MDSPQVSNFSRVTVNPLGIDNHLQVMQMENKGRQL